MSAILDYFIKQQNEIRQANNELVLQIIRAFQTLFNRVQPRIETVRLTLENNPKITKAQIKRTGAYVDLIAQVGQEIDDFSTYAKVEIDAGNLSAVGLAVAHLRDFYDMNGIQANIIPPDAITLLTDLFSPGGELAKRMELWAPNVVDGVSNGIIEGVKLGRNPNKIAYDIRKAFGVGLTDAMRTTRTAQLWAYREATRLNYLANSDIVKGWIWLAALDDHTCMSCVSMHGTLHPLEESQNDHHNGRCTLIPYIPGVDYGMTNGQDWFDALDEAQKIKQMGTGKYQAYMDGAFSFDKLSSTYADPVYGIMRAETALKDLVNG